jgi:hypothetical protein
MRNRQYYTQACLLKLVRKRPLNNAYPNVNIHRTYKANNYHALKRKSLIKYILRQLAKNLNNKYKLLGKQGTCDTLFKLTLKLYRYTFVTKRIVTTFKAKLKHEGLIYRYLNEVQRELIPVYFKNISLVRLYFLDVKVKIVHMLLIS